MEANVVKKGPGIEQLKADLERLVRMDVLVGIPQEEASRDGEGINNAELMYLHTNGSPLQNIPKRPVIEPSIQAEGNKEKITEQLENVAQDVLQGNPQAALRSLKLAGLAGKNAATGWFVDSRNNWPPNAYATVQRKMSKMTSKQVLERVDSGEPITRPLIDTGVLRKSITFVVRERKDD